MSILLSPFKKVHEYFKTSLAASTLLQFAIRITLVVLAVTFISYWHIVHSLEKQTYDGLKNYIAERGQKESEIFRLAEDHHTIAKKAFIQYWRRMHDSKNLDFNKLFQAFPDGTYRIPQKVFDGVARGDGSISSQISGFVGLNAPIDNLEFRNRLVMSYWLISRFGAAWSSRFPNFYVTMPENVVIGYWPGLPWGLHADTHFDITKEEWYYVANQKNDPKHTSVWTGLYYDYTVDQWMVSCITPVYIDGHHLINLGHDILLNNLFERTFNDKLKGTYNFIFRGDGRLIAHPDKINALKKAAGQVYIRDLHDPVLSSIYQQITKALQNSDKQVLLVDDKVNNNILAVSRIHGPDWYFVTVYPKALLSSVALETVRFILWLGLISLALEMVMLYLVFRKKVLAPLETFSEASNEVAKGNYQLSGVNGLKDILKYDNEVGLLARTFGNMATEINEYSDRLENKVAERTEKLIRATEEAKKADQAKSDFLARMSHEIRTPMNAIIGMTRLTLKTPLTSKQRGYLDKIQISAGLLMGIINDILDFSKIEAGKLALENISFNLHEVLDNISHVISLKVESKGLELIYYIDPEVPALLSGDPLRLGQVLINIANNAVKFTEEGEITITVVVEQMLKDKVRLIFSVKDTGIGISPESADKLFTAFSQADGSVTRKHGGTGLGLAICKQLVEMMNGNIWVTSEPGSGSQFFFTAEFGLVEQQALPRRLPFALNHVKVLVVDDNETARHLLGAQLESFGMEVTQAASGREAIRLLENASADGKPFRLVMMDWKMPEMNGIEATRRIKSNRLLPNTPAILMVTAFAREEVSHQAEGAGLDGYLLKPVNASVLYDSIISVLGGESTGRAQRPAGTAMIGGNREALKGARVLLVEDNAINREVVQSYLENSGVILDVAENGIIAIEMLKAAPYQLVLMDIQMPELDGLTATRLLRSDEDFRDLPIIAMTAHAMAGDREKSLAAGMNDHIVKPIDPDELQALLLKWITGSEYKPTAMPNQTGKGPTLPASLPGIDMAEAVRRTRRDNDLLLKLLKNFYQAHSNLPAHLMAKGEKAMTDAEIRDTAHTIKPLAVFFGARHLADAAIDVEYAYDEAFGERETALRAFTTALEEVLYGLASLKTLKTVASDAPTRSVDTAKAKRLLQELEHLLKDDDANAEVLAPKLRHCLPGDSFASMLEQLEYLIDDVEYDKALAVVRKLTEALGEDAT